AGESAAAAEWSIAGDFTRAIGGAGVGCADWAARRCAYQVGSGPACGAARAGSAEHGCGVCDYVDFGGKIWRNAGFVGGVFDSGGSADTRSDFPQRTRGVAFDTWWHGVSRGRVDQAQKC